MRPVTLLRIRVEGWILMVNPLSGVCKAMGSILSLFVSSILNILRQTSEAFGNGSIGKELNLHTYQAY